jgi:hypothetical protein
MRMTEMDGFRAIQDKEERRLDYILEKARRERQESSIFDKPAGIKKKKKVQRKRMDN